MGRRKLSKRTIEQKETDVAFCSDLFLKGYTYAAIAKALNEDIKRRGLNYTITTSMVFLDMKQCLIEWKRQQHENIDLYVTQELQKLDLMEKEAWGAWEKSKGGRKKTKERVHKARPIKPGAEIDDPEYYGYNEEAVETSCGNPKFLDILLHVQHRRAKMLGFDAPIKIDLPNQSIKEEPVFDTSQIPPDLLFQFVDKIQAATYKKQSNGQIPN